MNSKFCHQYFLQPGSNPVAGALGPLTINGVKLAAIIIINIIGGNNLQILFNFESNLESNYF
jgi:hypothetical protein